MGALLPYQVSYTTRTYYRKGQSMKPTVDVFDTAVFMDARLSVPNKEFVTV